MQLPLEHGRETVYAANVQTLPWATVSEASFFLLALHKGVNADDAHHRAQSCRLVQKPCLAR